MSGKSTHKKPQAKVGFGHEHHGRTLPFEAIIMAGGKGERLRPLTENVPKPLLPIGKKPIAEYMVDRLAKQGVKNISFCVNYLGEQIQAHFGNGDKWKAKVDYVFEPGILGTIGGLAYKQEFACSDLLVINGDLLTTLNFEKFYFYFVEQDADLAIAAIPHRVSLAFGTLELENGVVKGIQEKPTYTYHLNSGIYFLRRELVDLIPKGQPFDAIDLIQVAIEAGLKVVSFPLLEYWIDIGQMEDYQKAQKDISFLDL